MRSTLRQLFEVFSNRRRKLTFLLLLNSKRSIFLLSSAILLFIFLLLQTFLIGEGTRHVFVSSAYYVTDITRNGQVTRSIRLLALAENNIVDLNLHCNLDGQLIKTSIMHTGGPAQCKYATYMIDCPSDSQPSGLSLIGSNKVKHYLTITKTDSGPKRNLVICFARMFYYEKWQIALAALELYKLHGADLMVIPISSVISQLYTILQAYEKEGTVRLKPAVQIPKFIDLDYDPNRETEWFQQVTAYTECLYDYRESADFILSVDMDDVLIPRTFNNLPSEFNFFANKFPDAASFEFIWTTTTARSSSSPNTFSINRMMKENYFAEFVNYGKSAIRPKRVNQAYVHHPSGNEVLGGFNHEILTLNHTLAVHFRALIMDDSPIQQSNSYFSNNTLYTQLDRNFQSFLDRNPLAKEAFYSLPDKFHYLISMHECYLDIGARLASNRLYKCPNPLQCTPKPTLEMPNCIVLENRFRHTLVSDNIHLASSISQTFRKSVNCLS